MDEEKSSEVQPAIETPPEFKKPVLFGRIGKLPKKAKSDIERNQEENDNKSEAQFNKACHEVEIKYEDKTPESSKSALSPAVLLKELSTPIPYKEPKWSGLCPEGSDYSLEVLKSGTIMQRVDLTKKAYYVFGRLANCDVVMAHPTISRHHSVLQYKAFAEEGEPPSGWYLYDLGSTHGTFLNKDRLKPNHYSRVRVGHQIKFGNSTRTYVVLGPDFDCEGESELTVTEIKQRALDIKLNKQKFIKEAIEQRERDRHEAEKKREEHGIDWGMGEDAEEDPDLAENPFASTTNEELYLEDPKKTLRGYFEREGHELTYDCEERGVGQFLCRVELPMDDARGRPLVAEVLHKGKKKEAVAACALEACRALDRAGLLRQSTHESRARKAKDWGADDYYDSDEDTFLDRTGSVERKRKLRMDKHGGQRDEDKPRTYDDLVKQITEIETKIALEEKSLSRLREASSKKTSADEEDDLDAYMDSLKQQGQTMAQKAEISNTKMSIRKLQSELAATQRLAEVARPAHLPPLVKAGDNKMAVKMATNSVVYGKRIKLKEDLEKKLKVRKETKQEETEFVEEMDSDEETSETKDPQSECQKEIADPPETKLPEKTETTIPDAKDTKEKDKKMYGPMRPPENYVIPENYFDQESDRDLPEITEKEE